MLAPCPFQGQGLGRSRKDPQSRLLGRECRIQAKWLHFVTSVDADSKNLHDVMFYAIVVLLTALCGGRLITQSTRRTTLQLASRRLALPSFGIGSLCVEHEIAEHITCVKNSACPAAQECAYHVQIPTAALIETLQTCSAMHGGCFVTPSVRRITLRLASRKSWHRHAECGFQSQQPLLCDIFKN